MKHLLQLIFVVPFTLSQRPRLISQLPNNLIEPEGQWVWGKLVNGFVYNAKQSFGGGGGSTNYIPTLPTGSGNLPTTGQLLATDKRFSTLVLALETAFGNETGLAAPFTVFAPTNKAFAKIDENTLNGLLEKPEDLQNVLFRHIVDGKAVRIPAGDSTLEAVDGSSIRIKRDLNDIFSENVQISTSGGSAKVVQFDMLTQDGVVHAIDTVI